MNKKVPHHAKENIFYQQYMRVFSKGIIISILTTLFIQCMNKAWRKSRDISSMQRQKIYPEGTLFQEALSGCVSRKLGKKPNIRKTGVWEETVAMQESRDRKSHLVVCATGGESTVPSVELGIGFPRAEI